jgi:hypothetical protein
MCRVQLVAGDTTLSQLAERALDDLTSDIHQAADEEDPAVKGERPAWLYRTFC